MECLDNSPLWETLLTAWRGRVDHHGLGLSPGLDGWFMGEEYHVPRDGLTPEVGIQEGRLLGDGLAMDGVEHGPDKLVEGISESMVCNRHLLDPFDESKVDWENRILSWKRWMMMVMPAGGGMLDVSGGGLSSGSMEHRGKEQGRESRCLRSCRRGYRKVQDARFAPKSWSAVDAQACLPSRLALPPTEHLSW